MATRKPNSPLLGYNTNVRHAGHLFHIQTEDSGVDHPHIITHLFTEGTILATKKTSYAEYLNQEGWEEIVRRLMKEQHKAMFVELRDGVHDEIAAQILGAPLGDGPTAVDTNDEYRKTGGFHVEGPAPAATQDAVSGANEREPAAAGAPQAQPGDAQDDGRVPSIFDTPDVSGTFCASVISDKSLDEVILDYLRDELDE